MKMSEMIAMLEKNPTLRFKRRGWSHRNAIGIKDHRLQMMQPNGELWTYLLSYDTDPDKDCFMEACYQLGACVDDWELIREPVTFMEAAQAISDGKTIMCDCNGKVSTYEPGKVSQIALNYILHGTWYIDE